MSPDPTLLVIAATALVELVAGVALFLLFVVRR
jgi:hypothetical protein